MPCCSKMHASPRQPLHRQSAQQYATMSKAGRQGSCCHGRQAGPLPTTALAAPPISEKLRRGFALRKHLLEKCATCCIHHAVVGTRCIFTVSEKKAKVLTHCIFTLSEKKAKVL